VGVAGHFTLRKRKDWKGGKKRKSGVKALVAIRVKERLKTEAENHSGGDVVQAGEEKLGRGGKSENRRTQADVCARRST